jgi:hypothetical protein
MRREDFRAMSVRGSEGKIFREKEIDLVDWVIENIGGRRVDWGRRDDGQRVILCGPICICGSGLLLVNSVTIIASLTAI